MTTWQRAQYQRQVAITIHEGVASKYNPATNAEYSNACPIPPPTCTWKFTEEKGKGSIESFGCIQCTESICSFECVDTKTNTKHWGKCYNERIGNSTCIAGKCTENIAEACKRNKRQAIVDGRIECVPNTIDHCGNHETSCRNREDYLKGACEEGRRIDFECKEGFHVNTKTKNCEHDTSECCGSKGNAGLCDVYPITISLLNTMVSNFDFPRTAATLPSQVSMRIIGTNPSTKRLAWQPTPVIRTLQQKQGKKTACIGKRKMQPAAPISRVAYSLCSLD